MTRALLSLCTLALLAASPADAVDWTPKAEFGLVNTSGNSDTMSIHGRFALVGEHELWTHGFSASGLRAETEDVSTANRFELVARTARKMSERSYLGLVSRYESDDFSPYDYQETAALKYGYWAIRDELREFRVEIGPGFRRARVADTGNEESGPLLRGFADYWHQLTPSTSFFNTLLVEASSDNTFVQNEIGIEVSINRSFALKAAYQARHNTDALPNRERTDTLTSVSIVWTPGAKAE